MKFKILSALCVLIGALIMLATFGQTAEVNITPVPVAKQIYMISGDHTGGNEKLGK